ncbi:MAG: nucleotidyltransferase domain-containing protein, partial [Candidatus Thorarchaeota archaeon]
MVEHVISNIQEAISSIQKIPGTDAILLFGSHIDGTATDVSDYDLCIVASTLHSASE